MEAYAFQLLKYVSDLTGDEELMEARSVYLETAKARRMRRFLES